MFTSYAVLPTRKRGSDSLSALASRAFCPEPVESGIGYVFDTSAPFSVRQYRIAAFFKKVGGGQGESTGFVVFKEVSCAAYRQPWLILHLFPLPRFLRYNPSPCPGQDALQRPSGRTIYRIRPPHHAGRANGRTVCDRSLSWQNSRPSTRAKQQWRRSRR